MKSVLEKIILLFIAVSLISIYGCNKDKEDEHQNIQSYNAENVKKAIATLNTTTGNISYGFDIKALTEKVNSVTKEDDRYIIESFELEPRSILMNDSIHPALKIVIIDTEEETTYTHWLCDGFLEKILDSNNIEYYLSENIYDGSFSFISPDDGKYRLSTVQDGLLVSSESVEHLDSFPPIFPWDLTCTTTNHCFQCGKDFWKAGWHCSCENGSYGTCQESVSIGNTLTIIGIIIGLIALV
jgi:hypothetical protein